VRAPLADVRGVVFDFDGTLTAPAAIDFVAMRAAVGCPEGAGILRHVESLPSAGERAAAMARVEAIEAEAAGRSLPLPDAEALVAALRARGIPIGVLTRNSLASVRLALANFRVVTEAQFAVIVTREAPHPPKPAPDGVISAARAMGLEPADVVMIGDYRYDIEAGAAAGARTIWIHHGERDVTPRPTPDYEAATIAEIAALLGVSLASERS